MILRIIKCTSLNIQAPEYTEELIKQESYKEATTMRVGLSYVKSLRGKFNERPSTQHYSMFCNLRKTVIHIIIHFIVFSILIG